MTEPARTATESARVAVHVVYEHGVDFRPYSSAFLRLLRPLTHPGVAPAVDASFGLDYHGKDADVVVVDRLWRPDVSMDLVDALLERIRKAGARMLYSLDDNLFDLPAERADWPEREHLSIAARLLREADRVMVSTSALRDRLRPLNACIEVVANHLDERLLVRRAPIVAAATLEERPLVIGYMGTYTHDEDLAMVLPALRAACQRHQGQIEVQIVGAVRRASTWRQLADLPARPLLPRPEEHEYPLFMLWFTSQIDWDIAIAPLRDSAFSRCKSDVKFLDYASIGAAGIYSSGSAYEPSDPPSIVHGESGWLVENTTEAWETALETLIADRELRGHLARGASQRLYAQRILARRAPEWVEAVRRWAA